MLKVSVALTTYNGMKYIEHQLDSLRLQIYHPYEVIIVDDNSNDLTQSIIREYISRYKLKNWKLFINDNNLGFVNNFKKAISLTSGDYIFLCDQDDIWQEDKIDKMIEIILKNKGMKLLACNLRFIGKTNEIIKLKSENYWTRYLRSSEGKEIRKIDFWNLAKDNYFPGCLICFDKNIKDEYLNTENPYGYYHDHIIILIAAALDSAYFYTESLVDYRIHDDNTIGTSTSKRPWKRNAIIHNYLVERFCYTLAINKCHVNQKLLQEYLKFYDLRIKFYKDLSFLVFLRKIVYEFKFRRSFLKFILVISKNLFFLFRINLLTDLFI